MRTYVVKANTYYITDLGMGRENASEDFKHTHSDTHKHAYAQTLTDSLMKCVWAFQLTVAFRSKRQDFQLFQAALGEPFNLDSLMCTRIR